MSVHQSATTPHVVGAECVRLRNFVMIQAFQAQTPESTADSHRHHLSGPRAVAAPLTVGNRGPEWRFVAPYYVDTYYETT
jgi:hypothetical protein